MSPIQRLLIGAIVLLTAAGGFGTGRTLFRPKQRVAQPIQFNHLLHVEELGIECIDCHEYFETRAHSGLPSLGICMECHEEPLTDLPEERKILELAKTGEQDVFRKLFRLPDHTHYSHRRHVGSGELDCEVCHGSIAEMTLPPPLPLVRIDMDFCVECHQRMNVSTDCTGCHR